MIAGGDNNVEKTNKPYETAPYRPLKRCPFCGGQAALFVSNPMYGLCGAFVKCKECRARTDAMPINDIIVVGEALRTPVTDETIQRGCVLAADAWNKRTQRGKIANTARPDAT